MGKGVVEGMGWTKGVRIVKVVEDARTTANVEPENITQARSVYEMLLAMCES